MLRIRCCVAFRARAGEVDSFVMTLEELPIALAELGSVEATGSAWRVTVDDRSITCLLDGERLRLVCPVIEHAGLTPDDLERLLVASFDTLARYASFEGVVVSLYRHRIASLEPDDLAVAFADVLRLATDPPLG